MSYWYWDKEIIESKTPSIQDGIEHLTEYKHRKDGARFIMSIGSEMDLGYNTLATGVVFFHRFYMFHSFNDFPKYVTAACCLFLAGKVEETPKKCKDICRLAKMKLNKENFASFGVDPKEEVTMLEKVLLQTVKFDFKVDHPYSYLTKYAKCLKGDRNKLEKMVQMAWTFVNDSLCTTLSIEWEPEIIAIAVMYLSGKLNKFKITDWKGKKSYHKNWWDMFIEDLNIVVLEDICHQILDLYSPQKEKEGLNSLNTDKSEIKISTSSTVASPVNSTTITTVTTVTSVLQSIESTTTFSKTMADVVSTTSTVVTPVVLPRKFENLSLPSSSWTVLPPILQNKSVKDANQTRSMPVLPLLIPDFSIPPPNLDLINLYIKQENSQSSENDSPSSIFVEKSPLFKSTMNNQNNQIEIPTNRTFMDRTNNSWQNFQEHQTDFACMMKYNNHQHDAFKRWNSRNFNRRCNNRDSNGWKDNIRNARDESKDQMRNFRRNRSEQMRNSRQFF